MGHKTEVAWAISKGAYSDYRVLCICRTKADAEALAARYNASRGGGAYDEAAAEEFPIVPSDVQQVEVLMMSVEVHDDGTATNEHVSIRTEWPFDDYLGARPVEANWNRAPYMHQVGGRLDVRGTDHERVRHVYSDLRAALLVDDALRAQKHFTR